MGETMENYNGDDKMEVILNCVGKDNISISALLLELSVKSLEKEDGIVGFILLWENFMLRAC